MFRKLGHVLGAKPIIPVIIWAVILAAALLIDRNLGELPAPAEQSFLPPDSPQNRAIELMEQAFPQMASRSQIFIVAYRPEGLDQPDLDWLNQAAQTIQDRTGFPTLSPTMVWLEPRLMDRERRVAIAVVGIPSNFISPAAIETVNRVDDIVRRQPPLPPRDLVIELTGSAAAGRDYFAHASRAVDRTTWVTVLAVLTILILVYRSPAGAFVPLAAIGASVVLAFITLTLLTHVGWQIADMERIFVVVLIFGAGVDYTLFWISRYREALSESSDYAGAAVTATRSAGPAILTSAATTICGLTTLIAADLEPTKNAGRVLAVVLTIALLAALTLAPAIARLFGRWLFWPGRAQGRTTFGERHLWPKLAESVTRSPIIYLVSGVTLLAGLGIYALKMDVRFDSLGELPPHSSSERGYRIARRYLSKGQISGNNILLKFKDAPEDREIVLEISRELGAKLAAVQGIHDVYAMHAPLGQTEAAMQPDDASSRSRITSVFTDISSAITRPAEALYYAPRHRLLRFEILLDHEPFSPQAMDLVENTLAMVRAFTEQHHRADYGIEVHAQGPTAYVLDIRDVTRRDQVRVMLLATVVIAAIVLILIRDWPLTLFMLAATWLTYGACLTLSSLFFVHVMDMGALDWKVRLIVFVIVVAVGQDYNIFLVARLMQAPDHLSPRQAARLAITRTGPVISNCGLIMAATLGSLWAGGLMLLQQVGFALALGILIDTFFVRPVLVPSFCLVTGRRQRWARKALRSLPG